MGVRLGIPNPPPPHGRLIDLSEGQNTQIFFLKEWKLPLVKLFNYSLFSLTQIESGRTYDKHDKSHESFQKKHEVEVIAPHPERYF